MFAHNDLLLGNVIYNEGEGTVSFIDFEYANYNYQAFDIANHFNEYAGKLDISNLHLHLKQVTTNIFTKLLLKWLWKWLLYVIGFQVYL